MPAPIILVDEKDNQTGTAKKLYAHQKGLLHRAFSIVIFDHQGNILLQKRALTKYHSAGLWTNACCSHPAPGEYIKESALIRLNEEMGFKTEIKKIFDILYKIELENGIIENEYDHVFTGTWEGVPNPDPSEVTDWKWISREDLKSDLKLYPENYTYWFKLIMERMDAQLNS